MVSARLQRFNVSRFAFHVSRPSCINPPCRNAAPAPASRAPPSPSPSSPAARDSSVLTWWISCSLAATGSSPSTISSLAAWPTSTIWLATPVSGSSSRTSPSTSFYRGRWTTCGTSPRRPARWIIWSFPSRPSKSVRSAHTRPSDWPRKKAPGFCLPRPRRFTATRSSIRRPKPTGATSTRSARAAVTTNRSASPKRS